MTANVAEIEHDLGLVADGQEAAAEAAAAWSSRSRHLAATGEIRLAMLTQWAADVATLHCLLWESGLSGVPDPGGQLDAVAQVVQEGLVRGGDVPAEAAAVLDWARTTLAQAFGAPADALLTARLTPLAHLEPLGTVPSGTRRAARGADILVRDLRDVAHDCSVVARAMAAAGLVDDADDQLRRAMLATLEACLVARGAGGEGLTSAELRWELAVAPFGDRRWADLSAVDLAAALVAAVDPADRETLRVQLEALR